MTSLLGFGSTVVAAWGGGGQGHQLQMLRPQIKPRHLSSYGSFDQHSVGSKLSSLKISGEAPSIALVASWSFGKDVRRGKVHLATDSNQSAAESDTEKSGDAENAASNIQLPLSSARTSINTGEKISPQMQKPTAKGSPLTARERLRAARVLSRYTESKPAKPQMGSKVLDALRESDKGKKRSGLPEAPTNMLDDSKRGLSQGGWNFDFPVGGDLLLIIFSFVFISTVMFTTTYIVWKVGAIHFNEY